jgi:hypothetical protein
MTVQSYNGNLDFGFVSDRDLVPDLWVMTDLLHEEMADLVKVATKMSAAAAVPKKAVRKQAAAKR